jgi:hypothetical protein
MGGIADQIDNAAINMQLVQRAVVSSITRIPYHHAGSARKIPVSCG